MLVFLFALASAISTGLDGNKEACFGVVGKQQAVFSLTYVVSGFQEDNFQMTFYSPRKTVIKQIIKQKEGSHKEIMSSDGTYEVCFKTLDKYYKLISFNFDFIEDDDVALAETMDQMAKELKTAYRSMQTIQHNQHYQNDRENEHARMLESTEQKLSWCSVAKMITLVLVCGLQIFMLTNYFKNTSFGPQV